MDRVAPDPKHTIKEITRNLTNLYELVLSLAVQCVTEQNHESQSP